VFSGFDELADHHKLEKIKTIRDSYMVAVAYRAECGSSSPLLPCDGPSDARKRPRVEPASSAKTS